MQRVYNQKQARVQRTRTNHDVYQSANPTTVTPHAFLSKITRLNNFKLYVSRCLHRYIIESILR